MMSDDWVLESWENESSRSRKSKDEKWEQLSRRRKDVCGWDHKRKKISCTVTDFISDRLFFFFFFLKKKIHICNTLTHKATTFFFFNIVFSKNANERHLLGQDYSKSQTFLLSHTRFLTIPPDFFIQKFLLIRTTSLVIPGIFFFWH